MGLDIKTIKPTKLIGEDTLDDFDYQYLHQKTQNEKFYPLVHNTLYTDGYYEVGFDSRKRLSMPYPKYRRFRNTICEMAVGVSDMEVWSDVEKYKDSPFIYLISFTDCDGCYDYTVAERLLANFKAFEDKAKELVVGEDCDYDFYDDYKAYIAILEECVKIKGVVVYY